MEVEGRITFHPLEVRRRIHDVVVGREEIGSYLVLTPESFKILQYLKNHTIAQTKKAYPNKHLKVFVEKLKEKEFIYKIGHHVLAKHRTIKELFHIPKRNLTWLRHPITIILYILIVLFGAWTAIQNSLLVHPTWYFFTGWYTILLLATCGVYWGLLFLHELGHYLALRSTGHKAGLAIVHRWHLLLPYANIENARVLEKKQRIFVYAAGILMDVLVISILTILLSLGILPGFLRFIILLASFNLVTQFIFMRKTDVTTIVEHALGVDDIHAIIKKVLDASCIFCKKSVALSKQEKRIGTEAFPLYVISFFLLAVILFGFIIPILWELAVQGIKELFAAAPIKDDILFTDSFLALILLSVFISFYFVTLLQDTPKVAIIKRFLAIAGFALANYFVLFLIALPLLFFTHTFAATLLFLLLGLLYGNLFSFILEHLGLTKETPLLILVILGVATMLVFLVTGSYAVQSAAPVVVAYPIAVHCVFLGIGIILSYFSPRAYK